VNISGNVDWQLYTYTVPSGLVTLTWEYAKNASISSGSDAGWIDQVTYTVPAFNFSQPIITNNAVQLTLNGTNGQRLFIDGSVDLVNWTSLLTNTLSSSQAIFTDTQFTNNAYRSYRALHKIE
jgi:hypothetical protein